MILFFSCGFILLTLIVIGYIINIAVKAIGFDIGDFL
jgi:hypothetical protein